MIAASNEAISARCRASSSNTAETAAFQRETRTIPIVFVIVGDPVRAGFVAGLPRPGGNITGFSTGDATIAGKWLELFTNQSLI
jgi:putative ABC transport system substrate-binding protein